MLLHYVNEISNAILSFEDFKVLTKTWLTDKLSSICLDGNLENAFIITFC